MQEGGHVHGNESIKREIMATNNYAAIKACGRRVINLRPTSGTPKRKTLCFKGAFKFTQNPTARGSLLETDSIIEQTNPNDPTCPPGKNLLGNIRE